MTAEPITSSSTYYNNTYRVTFPTTSFNQFYVVNKTGVAPTDYSSYNLVAGTTSTTLNASDFNATTGTCTLFVIAWNSNYNYNYNWLYRQVLLRPHDRDPDQLQHSLQRCGR